MLSHQPTHAAAAAAVPSHPCVRACCIALEGSMHQAAGCSHTRTGRGRCALVTPPHRPRVEAPSLSAAQLLLLTRLQGAVGDKPSALSINTQVSSSSRAAHSTREVGSTWSGVRPSRVVEAQTARTAATCGCCGMPSDCVCEDNSGWVGGCVRACVSVFNRSCCCRTLHCCTCAMMQAMSGCNATARALISRTSTHPACTAAVPTAGLLQ